ncbi:MAG: hypothetical protein ACOYMB_01885 [Patescibacteria group bacterium]
MAISVLILIAVLGYLGFAFLKVAIVKLPKWAKLNPIVSWGIEIFDNNPWAKKFLIKLMQAVLILIILWLQMLKYCFKTALKIVGPKGLKV